MTSQISKRPGKELRTNSTDNDEGDGYSDDYEEISNEEGEEAEKKERSPYLSVFDGQIKKPALGSRSSSRLTSLEGPDRSSQASSVFRKLQRKKSNASYVKNRVDSARIKERNELTNKIHILQGKITSLQEENRTLNRLIKRQGKELSKLYGVEGELPNLLRAHQEEIRILKVQMKKHQDVARNLNYKLSEKESQLFKMREANRHLKTLSEDNGLEEREDLQSTVDDLQVQLSQRDNELKELMHKLSIKEKNHKQQISNEKSKLKILRKEIEELSKKNEGLAEKIKKKDKQLNRLNIYSLSRRNPSSSKSNNLENNISEKGSRVSASSSLLSLNFREKDLKERRSISELPVLNKSLTETQEIPNPPTNNIQKTSSESSFEKSGLIYERSKSFSAAKRFFQKEEEGSEDAPVVGASSNKIGLWMPLGNAKEDTKDKQAIEMQPMFTEKPLDFSKKKDLLSKLEEIDSSLSYQPSFPALERGNYSRITSSHASSSTLNSSIGLHDKPSSSLMKELFGM